MATDIRNLRQLTPVPQSLWGSCCVECCLPRARWQVRGSSSAIFVCALCVLYRSTWGIGSRPDVDAVIELVQRCRKTTFALEAGLLRECSDADRVLGVSVLTDRILARVV